MLQQKLMFTPSKSVNLPPINIVIMLNTFSGSVLADTLPKPTLVRDEHVKYSAVT